MQDAPLYLGLSPLDWVRIIGAGGVLGILGTLVGWFSGFFRWVRHVGMFVH